MQIAGEGDLACSDLLAQALGAALASPDVFPSTRITQSYDQMRVSSCQNSVDLI